MSEVGFNRFMYFVVSVSFCFLIAFGLGLVIGPSDAIFPACLAGWLLYDVAKLKYPD